MWGGASGDVLWRTSPSTSITDERQTHEFEGDGATARVDLEIYLLTVLPVLSCIDTVYSYINIYFSFIKKHFMELNYSLIVGRTNWRGQSCFSFCF